MPIIEHSEYAAPMFFGSGHVQTIYASRFRKIGVNYERSRFDTSDGDFVDLDWIGTGSRKAVIICHGCESCTYAPYMQAMARAFARRGWDAIAMNFRGCSGEPNRFYRSYHSGETGDLKEVISHVESKGYESIAVVGFSLGGNTVLKYVGEMGGQLPPSVKCAAAVSVPCDLKASGDLMAKPENVVYMEYFMHSLRQKIRTKREMLPSHLSICDFESMRTFREFDDLYTGPAHGFRDAEDYWQQSHCLQYLPGITIPTLLVTAKDDPFFPSSCYPYEEASQSDAFFLEVTENGGHVGFVSNHGDEYWHEQRVPEFLDQFV